MMNTNVLFAEKSNNAVSGKTPGITMLACANSMQAAQNFNSDGIHIIKLACSAMIRDIFILKAFEAGAGGVMVVGCSPEKCKRQIGSIYARKRVEWTRKILDDIGLGSWRLVFAWEKNAASALSELEGELASHAASTGFKGNEPKLPYVPGDYAALQDRKYRRT